uniref:Bm8908 n=1 Tax=Brugia malayi TaxID=6279 RepID=A0A1I9G553_BRUMA|nr:Bm8908 [Brugia malayi]
MCSSSKIHAYSLKSPSLICGSGEPSGPSGSREPGELREPGLVSEVRMVS